MYMYVINAKKTHVHIKLVNPRQQVLERKSLWWARCCSEVTLVRCSIIQALRAVVQAKRICWHNSTMQFCVICHWLVYLERVSVS